MYIYILHYPSIIQKANKILTLWIFYYNIMIIEITKKQSTSTQLELIFYECFNIEYNENEIYIKKKKQCENGNMAIRAIQKEHFINYMGL